jgi:hypothetical protein
MHCGGCNEENALVAETCAYCGRSLLRPPRRKWCEWLIGGGVTLYLWLVFYLGFEALDAGEPWLDSPIKLAIYTLHRYLGTTVSLIVITRGAQLLCPGMARVASATLGSPGRDELRAPRHACAPLGGCANRHQQAAEQAHEADGMARRAWSSQFIPRPLECSR